MCFLRFQVEPGTSSHKKIRLASKGLKKVNTFGYGDHYVIIKVGVPKKLNEKQRALIMAYAELEEGTPGTIHGITNKTDGNYAMFSVQVYRVFKKELPNFKIHKQQNGAPSHWSLYM